MKPEYHRQQITGTLKELKQKKWIIFKSFLNGRISKIYITLNIFQFQKTMTDALFIQLPQFEKTGSTVDLSDPLENLKKYPLLKSKIIEVLLLLLLANQMNLIQFGKTGSTDD